MILPVIFKRKTSRRTSKRRQLLSNSKPTYDALERRNLLATFVVTTTADVVDAEDGLLSLREAVTAANSNEVFSDAPAGDADGDRIVFAELDATQYTLTEGQLEITDDLTIRGFGGGGGNGSLVIHGDHATRLFNVTTPERVRFQDLVLEAGFTEGAGGIVQVSASGDVVFRDAQLAFGDADTGGAISLVDSQLYLLNTEFRSNSSESGGAIHATGSDIQIVGGSSFLRNASTGDGGAIHATGGRLRLVNSDFGSVGAMSGNTASGSGGAVHFVGTADDEGRLISNSTNFDNNVSSTGGAIFVGENTAAHVLFGSFDSNGAAVADDSLSSGGAIYSEGNGLYLTDASFNENRSFQGAAVFSAAESSNFNRVSVSDNQAGSTGGGLLFHGGEAFVTESDFRGNDAEDSGGGIAIDAGAKVVLRRVTISENSADRGAGVSAAEETVLRVFGSTVSDNEALVFGGGIWATNTDLVVAASTFDNNVATDESSGDGASAGGGIAAFGSSTLIFDSTFSRNATNLSGGAILVSDGFARLQDTDLNLNDSVFGGAINVDSATLVLVGGQLTNNSADRSGAIHTNNDSRVFVRGGTRFESNVASGSAGAIEVAGLLNLEDAEFVANSAERGGAISLRPTGTAFIRNSSFLRNVAETNGSAIFARGELFTTPFLSVSGSTISENEITENEGGRPIDIIGPVFSQVEQDSFFGNIPSDGVGVFDLPLIA